MKMSNRKRKVMRTVSLAIAILFMMSLLAACMPGSDTTSNDQKRVLRIATVYGDRNYTDHLRSQYTDIFQFTNRNIEIEFVSAIDYGSRRYGQYNPEELEPDPVEEMMKLMEGPNPPDLIFLSLNELPGLIDQNMLAPLEPLIAEDNFDISDFVPAVINGIRMMGNDQLYALAPTFTSQALIYNKSIFLERGVPFPEDVMFWDEIFDLAKRLTFGEGEEKKFGFSFSSQYYSDLYHDMRSYVAPLELSMFSEDRERLVVDSQAWEDVWQAMFNLHQAKVFPEPTDYSQQRPNTGIYNPFEYDAFLSGKVAMSLVDMYRINEIINSNRDADLIEGYNFIDWDIVTVPVHPQAPNIGGYVFMDLIIGINAKAQNRDDAWRFMKFLNGEEWAELKSQSSNNMVSRQSFIKPRDGLQYNIEAFFKLMPAPQNNVYRYFTGRSNEVMWRIEGIGQQKFREVLEGNIAVRDALKQWQTEGNTILQNFRDNPDAPIWEEYYYEDSSIDQPTPMKESIIN